MQTDTEKLEIKRKAFETVETRRNEIKCGVL